MACGPFGTLRITDGTDSVDLFAAASVFHIVDWRPQAAPAKAVWRSSSLSDGRQLAMRHRENVIETLVLEAAGFNADHLIRELQDLRRLLEKAVMYWTTDWQDELVWIEAQGLGESNPRYSLIHDYRLSPEDFPYGEPFWSTLDRAGMSDLDLILEREDCWRADEPGTGTCVELSAVESYNSKDYGNVSGYYSVTPLLFDGADDDVNCANPADLDNIPDFAVAGKGKSTVDGWIRADSYGENNQARIADKTGSANRGWQFRVDNASGLYVLVNCATDAIAGSGLDEFTADGLLHHVLFTYDETGADLPAARTIYIAVDGNWVTSYNPPQQVSVGNYVQETNDDLIIGDRSASDRCFDGLIGWLRISDAVLYSPADGNFDPPPMCPLPAVDANTQGLYIWEGAGGTTGNAGLAGGTGTITNATWSAANICELDSVDARDPTCDEEVYVANKRNEAQITNVHYWDGANWTGNLVGAGVPFAFLPNPVVQNNVVVFGCNTALADSGPFCSLVFDISTAMVGVTNADFEWRYSIAPGDIFADFLALTVQDNTHTNGLMAAGGSAFDTTGVRSVHWAHPSNWGIGDPGVGGNTVGVNGYWVAVVITGDVAGTPPWQQNRDIYTVTWPYVEVQATEVLGDVTALARYKIRNQSDHNVYDTLITYENRVIAGLRSVDRGTNFTAYLNFADEQNPASVTVFALGTGAFAARVFAPTGRVIAATPVGAPAVVQARILIDYPLSTEYDGAYAGFLRAKQTGGAAGQIHLTVYGHYASLHQFYNSGDFVFLTTNDWQIFDLGKINIPAKVSGANPLYLRFEVFAYGNGAATMDLYDLILIPVDEIAIECLDATNASNFSRIGGRGTAPSTYLDIDPLTQPKEATALVKRYANDRFVAYYLRITPDKTQLQANARQRLWFFRTRFLLINDTEQRAEPWITDTVQAWKNQRYLSMRGNR